MLTHDDEITRLLLPAIADLMPGSALQREKRIDYALGSDGRVNAAALQIGGAVMIRPYLDDSLYSTTNTITFVTGARFNLSLTDGSWYVALVTMARLTHSAAANVAFRSLIQSIASDTILRPAVSAGGSPFYTAQTLTVAGNNDVECSVQFRGNSAGTTTISDTVLLTIAVRQ